MEGSLMELRAAVRRNDPAAIRAEIDAGAPVNRPEKRLRYETILQTAAELKSVTLDTLKALVEAGADPLIGATEVVRRAASTGELQRVKYFESLGCPIRFVDHNGYTALHAATLKVGEPATALVEYLLDAGVDPDARSKWNETAIGYCLHCNHFGLANLLLDRGAMKDDRDWPAVFGPVIRGEKEELAKHQAEVNREFFSFGAWSALQIALRKGDMEVVERLHRLGADLTFTDRGGDDLFLHALEGGHLPAVEWAFFHVRGGKVDPDEHGSLHGYAATSDSIPLAMWLVDHGIEFHETGDYGDSPLHSVRSTEMAAFYLERGADIDKVSGQGYTPLMSACQDDAVEMARFWIEQGADLEATSSGATALHSAVGFDSLRIVDMLLDAGANVEATDVDGDPPLSAANSVAMARKLIAAGANVDREHWVYGSIRKYLLQRDPAFSRLFD